MKNYHLYIKLFLLLSALLIPATTLAASGIQATTTASITDVPSAPVASKENNAWIYTKLDSSGFAQVYYQYLDSSSTPAILREFPLTTSGFNKSNALWGAWADPFDVFVWGTKIPALTCENQTFYYLADSNNDGNTEIHFSCFSNFLTPSAPSVKFDLKLTEWTVATTFNVVDFDVTWNKTSTIDFGTKMAAAAYAVVFTASDGSLHLLQHKSTLYTDRHNIGSHAIVIDHTDSGSLYDWQAWTPLFEAYSQPRFDEHGYNIIFLGKPAGQDNDEIGTIWITGKNEHQLTALNQNLSNARFINSLSDHADTYGIVNDIFFEVTADNITRPAHLWTQSSLFGTASWCNIATYLFEDATHSRQAVDTRKIGTDLMQDSSIQLSYEFTQADGLRDIYTAQATLPYDLCTGTSTSSMSVAYGTTPVTSVDPLKSHMITEEVQLTCLNDNTVPAMLPEIYFDELFSPSSASSSYAWTDIIGLRRAVDGTGTNLTHLYNVEEATSECADTCWENADSTTIDDNNSWEDGDGVKDSCENPGCTVEALAADTTGDYDGDGLPNNVDNCPCSWNPTQYDPDLDGVGDVYHANNENGCDNCQGVYNPADVDVNNDGVVPSTLDTDDRQTDSDGDGYGDSCETVETPDPVVEDVVPVVETDTNESPAPAVETPATTEMPSATEQTDEQVTEEAPPMTYGVFGGAFGGCSLSAVARPAASVFSPFWFMGLFIGLRILISHKK